MYNMKNNALLLFLLLPVMMMVFFFSEYIMLLTKIVVNFIVFSRLILGVLMLELKVFLEDGGWVAGTVLSAL